MPGTNGRLPERSKWYSAIQAAMKNTWQWMVLCGLPSLLEPLALSSASFSQWPLLIFCLLETKTPTNSQEFQVAKSLQLLRIFRLGESWVFYFLNAVKDAMQLTEWFLLLFLLLFLKYFLDEEAECILGSIPYGQIYNLAFFSYKARLLGRYIINEITHISVNNYSLIHVKASDTVNTQHIVCLH